jgi:hypothetical protein
MRKHDKKLFSQNLKYKLSQAQCLTPVIPGTQEVDWQGHGPGQSLAKHETPSEK